MTLTSQQASNTPTRSLFCSGLIFASPTCMVEPISLEKRVQISSSTTPAEANEELDRIPGQLVTELFEADEYANDDALDLRCTLCDEEANNITYTWSPMFLHAGRMPFRGAAICDMAGPCKPQVDRFIRAQMDEDINSGKENAMVTVVVNLENRFEDGESLDAVRLCQPVITYSPAYLSLGSEFHEDDKGIYWSLSTGFVERLMGVMDPVYHCAILAFGSKCAVCWKNRATTPLSTMKMILNKGVVFLRYLAVCEEMGPCSEKAAAYLKRKTDEDMELARLDGFKGAWEEGTCGSICKLCYRRGENMLRCKGCDAVSYCSEDCQKEDEIVHMDLCEQERRGNDAMKSMLLDSD
ncbi:hypothetical protein BJ508DRAFT_412418 [Ascobolus immersus RN42]|uniref:MYND-type domain-containing protein n=1 Tax=Ascobolus immersus RN42 TaxID=1160509 RepID=A0A3N4IHW1_ASCIM|nr:hypothetical protein BJ508DRAFT_412418 [Ascobolus immersus RN42]